MLLPGTARNAIAIPTHCQAQHLGKLQKAQVAGELTLSDSYRGHTYTLGSVLLSSKIRIGIYDRLPAQTMQLESTASQALVLHHTQHCYQPGIFSVFISFPPKNLGEHKRHAKDNSYQNLPVKCPSLGSSMLPRQPRQGLGMVCFCR